MAFLTEGFQRIAVTGGAGFIGSQVVRDLLSPASGNRYVHVIDDFSTGSWDRIEEVEHHPRFRFFHGSILQPDLLAEALKGCDAVLHLAVSNLRLSIRRPQLSDKVNASGTLAVLEEARRQGIKRFVYVSSSEVYGSASYVPMTEDHPLSPTTVYASSKLAGEFYALSYAKMYGMNCTVIRPFNNYGPRSHFERENGEFIPRTLVRLLNGYPPLIFGDGEQTRDYQYVTDTSRGLIMAMDALDVSGQIFNLAFGQEVSIRVLADRLCALVGREDLRPEFTDVQRPGDVRRHYADSSKFYKRFGFVPKTSLEEGLRLYLDWFQAQDLKINKLLNQMEVVNW